MDEKDLDIHIDTATNVANANDLIALNRYDAMIVDMNLPDGSGMDIAKVAREKQPDAKIAALTIYPSQYEDQKEYFDMFMKKPIMLDSYKDNFLKLLQI
jgi:DNA-binding response OmpR family regulator